MFSPTNLDLKPSFSLAIILGLPFLCAILLIAQADLPLQLSILWIVLAGLGCYLFLTRYALLASQDAICLLETQGSDLFISERSGRRMPASLAPGAFIHPWLCILTFNCEAERNEAVLSGGGLKKAFSRTLDRQKTLDIRRISGQPRRHVIICRYNACNLKEYRRLRVVLKFS